MNKSAALILTAALLAACTAPSRSAPQAGIPLPQMESTPLPAATVPAVEGRADTYRLQLHPDLQPFDFRLVANPSPQRLIDGSSLVGWIEVSQQGQSLDRIPVTFHDASQNLIWPRLGLRTLDINMDGYLDIAALERGGAEWGYFHWYEYDPKQQRFTSTALSDELSALENNGVAVDPQRREIYVYTLVATCPSTYIYVNAEGRLVLKQKQEYKQSDQGCVLSP